LIPPDRVDVLYPVVVRWQHFIATRI